MKEEGRIVRKATGGRRTLNMQQAAATLTSMTGAKGRKIEYVIH